MKKILFSTLALVLLAGAGCKKDKDSDGCELSSTAIEGSYKMTAATMQPSPDYPEVNVFNTFFDDCERDNVFNLNAGNVFVLQDAGVVCDPSDNGTGTWGLSGTSLTLTIDGDAKTGTVSGFTCNSFQFTIIETGVPLKITYTRQ